MLSKYNSKISKHSDNSNSNSYKRNSKSKFQNRSISKGNFQNKRSLNLKQVL